MKNLGLRTRRRNEVAAEFQGQILKETIQSLVRGHFADLVMAAVRGIYAFIK